MTPCPAQNGDFPFLDKDGARQMIEIDGGVLSDDCRALDPARTEVMSKGGHTHRA